MSDNFFREFEEKQKVAAAKAAENKRKANEEAAAAAAKKKQKANEAAAVKAAKAKEAAEKAAALAAAAAAKRKRAIEKVGHVPKAATISAGPLGAGAGPAPSPAKVGPAPAPAPAPAPSPGKAGPAPAPSPGKAGAATTAAAAEESNGCSHYTKETATIGIHKILYPIGAENPAEVDRIAGSFPQGTLPVHGESSNCYPSFTKLAIFLNTFIALPTDTPQQLQQKYRSISKQVSDCIASRVAKRTEVLAKPTRNKFLDAPHDGRIQQVYALFKKLEEMNTEGNFHRITNICFKYTNSRAGQEGFFQITYNKPPPPPLKNFGLSATTEKANVAKAAAPTETNDGENGGAWVGGKHKTRRVRKSHRKQTHRKR